MYTKVIPYAMKEIMHPMTHGSQYGNSVSNIHHFNTPSDNRCVPSSLNSYVCINDPPHVEPKTIPALNAMANILNANALFCPFVMSATYALFYFQWLYGLVMF